MSERVETAIERVILATRCDRKTAEKIVRMVRCDALVDAWDDALENGKALPFPPRNQSEAVSHLANARTLKLLKRITDEEMAAAVKVMGHQGEG